MNEHLKFIKEIADAETGMPIPFLGKKEKRLYISLLVVMKK